jgi:hypothetical protein
MPESFFDVTLLDLKVHESRVSQSFILSGESGAGKRLAMEIINQKSYNLLSSSLSRLARHLKIKSPGYSSKF